MLIYGGLEEPIANWAKASAGAPPEGSRVSEDDGKRNCRGRVKREVIAPPLYARGPPTTHNSPESPYTRDLPATRVLTKHEILKPLYSPRSLLPARHPLTARAGAPLSAGDISVSTISCDKGSDYPPNISPVE